MKRMIQWGDEMKYWVVYFENEQFWLELTEQLTAMRQIIIDENLGIHISAREDCLAEGEVIIDESQETYKEICRDEFNNQWRVAMKPYYDEWLSVKQKYPIGSKVEGICKYFYPQGAIVQGNDYFGVYTGKKEVLFNDFLVACVKDYDETNLWLVLG